MHGILCNSCTSISSNWNQQLVYKHQFTISISKLAYCAPSAKVLVRQVTVRGLPVQFMIEYKPVDGTWETDFDDDDKPLVGFYLCWDSVRFAIT